MKRFIILYLLIPLFSFSQVDALREKEEKRVFSDIEKKEQQGGTSFIKTYKPIYKDKDFKIDVLIIKDVFSGEDFSGLLIELNYNIDYIAKPYTISRKVILDKVEVEKLLRTYEFIIDSIISDVPKNYTEVSYLSNTSFKTGVFWDNGYWRGYFQIRDYDDRSFYSMPKSEFLKLYQDIKLAYSNM